MNLSRHKISSERKTLSGQPSQRGSKGSLPTLGAFLLGGVFVAAGTAILCIGLKVLPVDPKTVHAPYWVLSAVGTVFGLAGLAIMNMGLQQYLGGKRLRENARRFPDEFAFQDYNWDQRGFTPPRWKPAIYAVGGVAFLALFLSMFNWWAFFARGPFMVKAIVVLFDLILLAFAVQAVQRVAHAIKFGGSQIKFLEFPCRVSKPIELRWKPATGMVRANKGTFTLRCVEEFWVASGSGKSRSRRLVHEELWSGTKLLEEPHTFSRGEEINLRFELSGHPPSTHLSADRPIFWELEIKLDLPGLDFEERYLVPIYGTAKTASQVGNMTLPN